MLGLDLDVRKMDLNILQVSFQASGSIRHVNIEFRYNSVLQVKVSKNISEGHLIYPGVGI